MSYFIGMTVPAGRGDVASCFRTNFSFWQVTNAALGRALLTGLAESDAQDNGGAPKQEREAYLVTIGQVSDGIVGQGRSNEEYPKWFLQGMEEALKRFSHISLVLMWAQGQGTLKELPLKGEAKVSLEKFSSQFPDIEQNVRYIILP